MKINFVLILVLVFFFEGLAFAREPIQIQMGGETSTLDPYRAIDQYAFGILRNTMLGLFTLDEKGNLKNGLIDTYEISKNQMTYTFHLNKAAKWSDGVVVTADDFVTGLRHAINPLTASPSADYLFAIKNAEEIFKKEKPVETLGVYDRKGSVVIELKKPDPTFLLELSLAVASPLRQDILKKNQGRWRSEDPTTGDYFITQYHPDSIIDLEPNPYRKIEGQEKIRYRILTEEMTAMNLFETDKIDIISTVPVNDLERLKNKNLIQTVPSTTVFYISFNVNKPPFQIKENRRAVFEALKREELSHLLKGVFQPILSYLPPSIEGYISGPKNSGKTGTKDINKNRVRLAFGASAFTKIATEKMQNDLSKYLGLQVELVPMELKALLSLLKTDPPEMYFLGMSATYNDSLNQLNAFSHLTGENYSRYVSDEYEKTLNKIKETPKGKARTHLAEQANQMLIEKDIVAVPVVLRTQVYGVSNKVKNFQLSPYQVIHLSELRK